MKHRFSFFLLIFSIFTLFTSCSKKESEKRSFRIARESTWYAINLFGKERNVITFLDDLLDEISHREEVNIEKVVIASGNGLIKLKDGSIDALLTPLPPEEMGEERYLFSEKFLILGPVLVIRHDSRIPSLAEMGETALGIRRGVSLAFNQKIHPLTVIRYYEDTAYAMEHLVDDGIDGVILDYFAAQNFQKTLYKEKIKILSPPLKDRGFRLAKVKGGTNDAFIALFNRGLESMKKDGSYEKLLDKWKIYQ